MKKTGMLMRLAGRALRYRWLKAAGLPAPVEALSIEVTTRCVARCVMCNIWQMPVTRPEPDATRWLEFLASPQLSALTELDVTGGEPFLRDDLPELLRGVGALKATALPRLRSIAITTNGMLTERVLAGVSEVAGPLEAAGIGLVFACGMDGVGETHDRIRQVPGGWARLDETIRGLNRLRQRHPSLVPGIKTTVTRHNITELERVCRYADEQRLFTIISPYIVTANRYDNLALDGDLALTDADRVLLREFYRSDRFRWSYFRDELLRYLETGRMDKPCSAGFNYYFVRSSGELYPCPLIKAPLGNVFETPLERLMAGATARRFRRGVGGHAACAGCTEPGLERYALPFEGSHYLRLCAGMEWDSFRTLHAHLGLDKYLS